MTNAISKQPETKPDFLSQPLLATLNINWEKAIYIIFITIALITRFWDLGSRVMSHDESLHTQFSYQFFNGDARVANVAHSSSSFGPWGL